MPLIHRFGWSSKPVVVASIGAAALFSLIIGFTRDAPGMESPGRISGKVELRVSAPPAAARGAGGRYRSRGGGETGGSTAAQELTDPRNVVVYLEGKGLAQFKRPPTGQQTLDQRDLNFLPHVLPVVRGSTVDIVNRDNIYHNVFSLSAIKRFNIGRRPAGEAVPVTFDKTGTVQVFCDIHANMTAYVLVLENSFYTIPDAAGRYVLEDVPPGTYTLLAWHERLSSESREVTIQPGSTATIDFVLE